MTGRIANRKSKIEDRKSKIIANRKSQIENRKLEGRCRSSNSMRFAIFSDLRSAIIFDLRFAILALT